MSVTKDKERGTYTSQIWYTGVAGIRRKKTKRGFKTKADALAYERRFLAMRNNILDVKFKDFAMRYIDEIAPRLKRNTMETKLAVIESKILPYFGEKKICDISAADIRRWENTLLEEGYAQTTLHTICNQLSAIFNYAVNYYNLPVNPVRLAGKVGSKTTESEMRFWTLEEFNTFIVNVEDKPESYLAFNVLYWAGLRVGELLALTPADIDLVEGIVHVRKSYQRIKGEDIITTPKTKKSVRDVMMPDFLTGDFDDYLCAHPEIHKGDRIFVMTKHKLRHEMERGCKAAGMQPIRIHDLRHSHVSLLINLGMSPAAIADRVGHSSVEVTQTYSHLFPSTQVGLVNALNEAGGARE